MIHHAIPHEFRISISCKTRGEELAETPINKVPVLIDGDQNTDSLIVNYLKNTICALSVDEETLYFFTEPDTGVILFLMREEDSTSMMDFPLSKARIQTA